MVVLYKRWRVLAGLCIFWKQYPPPAPGLPPKIGISPPQMGQKNPIWGGRFFEWTSEINQITVKIWGCARAAAHTSHFRWQIVKYSLLITSVISVVFLRWMKTFGHYINVFIIQIRSDLLFLNGQVFLLLKAIFIRTDDDSQCTHCSAH